LERLEQRRGERRQGLLAARPAAVKVPVPSSQVAQAAPPARPERE
jgi:hypothetical protein